MSAAVAAVCFVAAFVLLVPLALAASVWKVGVLAAGFLLCGLGGCRLVLKATEEGS